MTVGIDLLDLSREQMREKLVRWGEPTFRADQIWNWLYVNLASTPIEMTNLPKDLRARLGEEARIGGLMPLARQRSHDGETVKWLFQLPPSVPKAEESEVDAQIETVLMTYEQRRTVCVSSQAGCGMGCTFCATGQMGLQRNLSAGEIVAQVLFVARELSRQDDRLTNVVLMGMGEPLANYDATMAALRRLMDPEGFNTGQRRLTVSTVGLVPAIHRFSREGLQVGLAVSLHAATDGLRSSLLPLNQRYPLDPLMAACRDYVARTGRRISFEWALISGVNDGISQARALGEMVRDMLCHVNLIPLNPTASYAGAPSSPEQVAAFRAELDRYGIPNTMRVRRGIDIQAGCGQLRQREMGKPLVVGTTEL